VKKGYSSLEVSEGLDQMLDIHKSSKMDTNKHVNQNIIRSIHLSP